ncbi:transcriptional regulatory protein [Tolypocladium capitatum]|uniref:Transcriptional regulatory protein n=1 Tax=Tolypocladium capitatum TaxID=45235 RepID=A0A2K3QEQ1_9HYPO|nr:transcriptional regulatory protein [Tolypocladium capitatum]
MGGLPALDSRHRLVPPDSPPELASPGASSLSSRSSPSTEQAWGFRTPASLPMSSYGKGPAADMPAGACASENGQDRTESSGQAAPRQQLPSLSSLFGPPTSMRPPRSPSDRDGTYLAHSPLDRPRASPSVGGGNLNSCPPPTASPPASQPRSTYDVRFNPERQSLHAFARSFSGPRSPSYSDRNHGRLESRSDVESSSRHEYSLGSRDSSFRSPGDKARGQFPGSKDSGAEYPDQRTAHGGANPPPTPTSTVASEGMPSKDGLGPKIWTGSYFLPRFVRATEVPGEGMCYFYDDGSHCKTVIDGEAVNAHWGVTKAGKPRKRLAIACVTCREKKIKCDPDYPRCVQCEKFGRVCKFKNAPRGGHNTSPSTPPAELDDMHRVDGPSRHHDGRISESGSSPPVSPRINPPQSSPDGGYRKRLKVGPESYIPNGEPSAGTERSMDHSKSQAPLQRPPPEILPRIPDGVLGRAWGTDPYGSDPESISAVLTQFFGQIDNTMIMRFFPEKIFRSWVSSPPHEKTPEDLMVLYSVLAIGVALSGGPKHIAYEYAQVAYYAQKTTVVACLQLVQSRILLAVYYISTCRPRDASELMSSAAAVAARLQLNQEIEKSRDEGLVSYPFGMNNTGYCEARRRTMWSLFMLERLNAMLPDRPVLISADDIYVRLPADSESFEKQVEAFMPMFDPDESTVSKLAERPSEITGYLIEMVHTWSICQSATYRLASRSSPSEADASKARTVAKKARDWHNSLPSRLTFGGSNLESAAFSGKVGSFLTMHLLYHHALVRLNRHHLSVARLSAESRANHLQECRQHATSILDIANCLDRILRVRPTILSTSPPAMSVAIVTAVDVLTASGPMASINELIQSIRVAKTAVDSMGKFWEHSHAARDAIEQRLQKLIQIYHSQGSRPVSPMEGYRVVLSAEESRDQRHLRWHIQEPMEKPYPMDMDVVYSTLA